MPVKRRVDKRRISPDAQLAAWLDVFDAGHDFFGDAADFTGLVEPCLAAQENEAEARQQWMDATRAAWARLGGLYLANYPHRQDCWALQQFGGPAQ